MAPIQEPSGTCQNCASEDEELVRVRRIYLIPEPRVVDEEESWCAACISQYPHERQG